jgi:hypothetical protein
MGRDFEFAFISEITCEITKQRIIEYQELDYDKDSRKYIKIGDKFYQINFRKSLSNARNCVDYMYNEIYTQEQLFEHMKDLLDKKDYRQLRVFGEVVSELFDESLILINSN